MRDDTAPRPSPRSVERLADSVGSEVRDLRGALQRALDAADRHEADGRQDLAVAVLEEQRELLAAVHRRLESDLAGAAVEREAEGVLAAAAPPVEATTPVALVPVEEPVAATTDVAYIDSGRAMAGRMLAATAAAVLGIALLLAPDGSGGQLSIAATPPGEPGPRAMDPTHRADDTTGTLAGPVATPADAASPAPEDTEVAGSDMTHTAGTSPEPAATGAPATESDEPASPPVDLGGLDVGGPQAATAPVPTIAPEPAQDDEAEDEDAEGTDDAVDGGSTSERGRDDEDVDQRSDGAEADHTGEQGQTPPAVGDTTGTHPPSGTSPAQPSEPPALGDGGAMTDEWSAGAGR